MLACPATFNFANIFFLGRIVSPFPQIVVCRLAAIYSCCLKLLEKYCSSNFVNKLIELFYCLLDWLDVLSAYSDSFSYRLGNARKSSALSR